MWAVSVYIWPSFFDDPIFQSEFDGVAVADAPDLFLQVPFTARPYEQKPQVLLVVVETQSNELAVLIQALGGEVQPLGGSRFCFDDQFNRGVAELLVAVEAVAYGKELLAVEFHQAFGAVATGLEGFDNFHIVT